MASKKHDKSGSSEPLEAAEAAQAAEAAIQSPEAGGAPPGPNLGRPPIDGEEARRLQAEADKRAEEQMRADIVARATIDAEIRARYAEREKLRPMPPITASVAPEVARPGEDYEIWNFVKPCFIWAEPDEKNPKRLKVSFGKGLQRVPKSLTDNWYLKTVGQPYEGKVR